MLRNNVSLQIYRMPEKVLVNEDARGYVALSDEQQYAVKIINYDQRRLQLVLKVEGKPCGTWIYDPYAQDLIERPVGSDHATFHFYRLGTANADASGLSLTDTLGLVQAEFTFEAPAVHVYSAAASAGSYIKDPLMGATYPLEASRGIPDEAGGTGLAGHSDQEWRKFEGVFRPDLTTVTLLSLRLKLDTSKTQPHPIGSIPYGNPVPPPVR